MFRCAWSAQNYYETFRHDMNVYDYCHQQLAIYNELAYLISHMGWTDEYLKYCEKEKAADAA